MPTEDPLKIEEEKHVPRCCDRHLKQLAMVTTIGFFLALLMLFYPLTQISSSEEQLISMLIGMLVSKWQTIIDFYFGSSHQ